ncbi:oxidoreductase [Acrocarpospora phusangensis]|uniref:Oxidoreductase n=1 Tax=Acrocarpospora phusangensis TaxID=1070424 RepID=A0A919QGE3_9ACTN|nr:FAD-dependent oxidoreductase [Acrocarpospora phusangensis]GIH25737.1 oxidoreductase [Acrocarpospora phusangensis]
MSAHEVVIVGGGLEGMSIAAALTRRGVRDVLVLERRTIGSGGTGKSSGIVRCHYGVPLLAAMAWEGVRFFEETPGLGFRRTGYVVGVGPENEAALRANVAVQRGLGVEVSLIGHDEVRGLWPGLETEDFAVFAYEPRGGHGDAYRTCQHFAEAARRGGARVLQHTPVAALVAERDRVTGVRLADGRRVGAGTVVVAAGAWSTALVSPAGVELPVRAVREPIVIADPGRPVGDVPVFSDLVSLQYVRTEPDGRLLIGNSDLADPEPADPDRYLNRADGPHLERAAGRFSGRFPGLPDVSFVTSYAGCYDVTPDFNPIIGPAGPDGLFVAAGFSGHGFKISPAVGRIAAEMITGAALPDFRLSRFAEGRPLTSAHPYRGAGEMR